MVPFIQTSATREGGKRKLDKREYYQLGGLVAQCSNRSFKAFSLQVNLNVMIRLDWRAGYLPVFVSYTAQTMSGYCRVTLL